MYIMNAYNIWPFGLKNDAKKLKNDMKSDFKDLGKDIKSNAYEMKKDISRELNKPNM
jgi:hypothetical protein